jgi:hypothetical protein
MEDTLLIRKFIVKAHVSDKDDKRIRVYVCIGREDGQPLTPADREESKAFATWSIGASRWASRLVCRRTHKYARPVGEWRSGRLHIYPAHLTSSFQLVSTDDFRSLRSSVLGRAVGVNLLVLAEARPSWA